MTTEQDFNRFANLSYWVDKGKEDVPFHPKKNTILTPKSIKGLSQSYKVLKVEDNTKNGMQAMAVAPIKNGAVDTSEIVIAYAGTNFDDNLDRLTDATTVVGGDIDLSIPQWWSAPKKIDGQAISAQKFATSIKKSYPNAVISTTGHSLGEYLAVYIAAENKWKNTGFNGPDPYNILSDDAKKWIKENPGLLANYRNNYDKIGNFGGNKTGAAILLDVSKGGYNPAKSLDYHGLSTWQFDKSGNLVAPGRSSRDSRLAQMEATTRYQLWNLSVLSNKLRKSHGGLSSSEEIFINSGEALIVVNGVSTMMQDGLNTVIKEYQQAITEAEALWKETVERAQGIGMDLSYEEVIGALASGGATQANIVGEPTAFYEQRIASAKQMLEKYTTLITEIQTSIDQQLAKDQQLGKDIQL
ncbi:lipase [Listeria booriae]|uniref:lipase n=1 Tax=Listeria booriae TaxID=1552123 RepID=UPI001624F21E|nr:lipase [Listeria booriae]MBC2369902.1 lipase [Listeria booriae]